MSDIFVIDKDLRTITIPDEVTLLGVESDDDVLRLNFQMPKTYGEYDLSIFSARINYVNANAEGDMYVVDDMEVDGDNITFTWLVGRTACKYKGNTLFNVCLKNIDGNGIVIQEFNTQPVTLPVLEGLETTDAVVQENPDIIEQMLYLLNGNVYYEYIESVDDLLGDLRTIRLVTLSAAASNELLGTVGTTTKGILVQNGMYNFYLVYIDSSGVHRATFTYNLIRGWSTTNKKNLVDTVDSAMSGTSTNPVQNKVVKAYIDSQGGGGSSITVDSALSSSSENPVQNKVINTALGNKADKIAKTTVSGTSVTQALTENTFYVFGEVSALTVTLATPADANILNEYHFRFTSGSTATTLTLPNSVTMPSDFAVEANKTYEISIVDNYGVYIAW